jgi:phosphatidylserine decarboxylase
MTQIIHGGCYHTGRHNNWRNLLERKPLRLPIAPEGWPFILPSAGAGIVLTLLGWWWLAVTSWILSLACALFFRDPERRSPDVPGGVLAPADGRVVQIWNDITDQFVGRSIQVSIFLSPLDVHVNRSPIAGLVADVHYKPGQFLPAYRSDASLLNEQCSVALQGEAMRVLVRQIAGVLARRIVCRVRAGEKLAAGERFGMIRFGSRVDLFLPRETLVQVAVGDRVRAGESVIGVIG